MKSIIGSDPELGLFFEDWLQEQEQDLHDLISAAKSNTDSTQSLVDRVMTHYDNYYRIKSKVAKTNILPMMTPSWRSTLEDAFLWIGGWRPTMAFHLLYSKSGLQLDNGRLNEFFFDEHNNGDLGDLSPSQMERVDELQRKTIKEEKALTEYLASHQETVADSSMVELSHTLTELTRESKEELVESTLSLKEKGFLEILRKADDLRLKTLRNVVDILSSIQAVHFFIAAAELHLRIHEWGKKKDTKLVPT